MSSAREDILGRIRAANGAPTPDGAAIASEAAALLPDAGIAQPDFAGLSTRQKFIERLTSERLTATVDEISDWTRAVEAVRAYLQRENLPPRIAAPPMEKLTGLTWGDIATHNDIAPDELVAVGIADHGIAETGTLVFTSRPDSPTLFNFLGLHHIVLVEATNVLPFMEDYWRLVRDQGNVQPRNINFVTGTSGTADIEAKNTRGAHGPRFLHVIIVGDGDT
jgi:L-lactate dehydrogenase complex protein LldG